MVRAKLGYFLLLLANNEEGKMHKYMTCQMQDGSVWAVPVDIIARNRAKHYAKEFGGDVERSLAEDTIPFFDDDYEIEDWAVRNMNWSDFNGLQVKVSDIPHIGPSKEWWINGSKGFLDELPTAHEQEHTGLQELRKWASNLQRDSVHSLGDRLAWFADQWQADIDRLQNASKS